MATITHRENGSWQVKIRKHGVRVSATFDAHSDAKAWATKTEAEIQSGRWKDTSEAERTTLADLLAIYREKILPGLRGNSYRTTLAHLDKGLGKLTLARLSSADVARYRDARLQAVSGDTVRKEMVTLSRIIDLAVMEWGYRLQSNPCKLVKKPSPGKARNRRLSDDEAARIWLALAECRSPWVLPVARFAVETAMRRGEILKLDWKHVDLTGRTAHLPETKTDEPRTVPLSSAAVAILESTLPAGKDGKPVRRIVGRVFPVSDSLVAQAWGHARDRAGLPDLRFHDLRHEATSRLFERGVFDSMEVATITGHKTLAMLKRYTHLRAEDLARKLG